MIMVDWIIPIFSATVGMNIYDLWKDAFCEVNGKKVTLEEALKAKQYKKVYFQIGINEMGRGTLDGFMMSIRMQWRNSKHCSRMRSLCAGDHACDPEKI